eukprot:TRINITY_DN7761_c0_g1_i2.p1 TRINITY_DN7761_c0_g1~~TRINITY_DN7761_c0_g1_i2.p1  ORF type:complete len:151 (-),score=33.57 TRINITY_DN7761_c0_g1_i2:171-623(-)
MRKNGMKDTETDEDNNCDVKVPEYENTKGNLFVWNKLDRKLKKDFKLLFPYPKGVHPPTMSTKFCNASRRFAEKYLIPEKNYHNLVALIEFFQAHPNVNEVLLDFAVTKTILAREDFSNDIPSPVIIDDVISNILNHHHHEQMKETSKIE